MKTALSMFPYPSGKLHMGHVRNYMISDCISKYYKMKNHKVFQPFGFDSFGLPAENAARKHNIDPQTWTDGNIKEMKRQLGLLDLELNWTDVETHKSSYYKHTQSLFRLLFKNKMAYKKDSSVYWDPIDKTVLAREQVVNGRSWRSGSKVEMKVLSQYYLRISDYSESLLQGLKDLNWPEHVKEMQRNWIGKSQGYEIKFNGKISVFTTRLETICGVTFIAISPEHPLAIKLMDLTQKQAIKLWLPNDKTKKGFKLLEIEHPLVNRILPVFVANYVENYGTMAVMGVPSEDARDFDFYKEMNSVGNPIAFVNIIDKDTNKMNESNIKDIINCDLNVARAKLLNKCKSLNICKESTVYRLRDWLVSRQRYWGCPIPIINCPTCKIVLQDSFVSLNSKMEVNCPNCNAASTRESDTLDTFVDSSWYYLRYFDDLNESSMFDKNKVNPITVYVGGVEHAVMHLLYARFINHFLFDMKLVNEKEPFKKLITQGMVSGPTYKKDGRYMQPHEFSGNCKVVYEKMSKSKHNGVDPEVMVKRYGADVVKMYMAFRAPISVEIQWDESQIIGISRWFKKLEKLDFTSNEDAKNTEIDVFVSNTIKNVNRAYESMEYFNLIPSELMKLTNYLLNAKRDNSSYRNGLTTLFKLMYPIASTISVKKLKLLNSDIKWPEMDRIEQVTPFKIFYKNRFIFETLSEDCKEIEEILRTKIPDLEYKQQRRNHKQKIINFI